MRGSSLMALSKMYLGLTEINENQILNYIRNRRQFITPAKLPVQLQHGKGPGRPKP
jgi:hypothetical protein